MTHKLDTDDYFIHRVEQHCAEWGLNFFLVEPIWVARFYDFYARNELWAKVLLNMHSEHHLPDDIYHRLVLLAHHKNTKVIDPPAHTDLSIPIPYSSKEGKPMLVAVSESVGASGVKSVRSGPPPIDAAAPVKFETATFALG